MSTNNSDTSALLLAAHAMRFAADHPYDATGIFGAAVGSGITYMVMQNKTFQTKVNKVFTPKVYQLTLTKEDLRLMLVDPEVEIRLEASDATVVVTSEKREELKQLPDIVIDGDVVDAK